MILNYMYNYTQMADFDQSTSENLKGLIHQMGTLRANIKHLIDTRDYTALVNIKLEENSSLMESLERFQNIDLMDIIDKGTGNVVDVQYKQDLVNVIARTKELLIMRIFLLMWMSRLQKVSMIYIQENIL